MEFQHQVLCHSLHSYNFCIETVQERTEATTGLHCQGLPNMHRGFLANFSRPRQPLYRQQHPAAQILKANSAPKMKIANVSCAKEHMNGVTQYPVSGLLRSEELGFCCCCCCSGGECARAREGRRTGRPPPFSLHLGMLTIHGKLTHVCFFSEDSIPTNYFESPLNFLKIPKG